MGSNTSIYMGLACVAYAVLLLCITALSARHNRAHQYRHEDDIEIRKREIE